MATHTQLLIPCSAEDVSNLTYELRSSETVEAHGTALLARGDLTVAAFARQSLLDPHLCRGESIKDLASSISQTMPTDLSPSAVHVFSAYGVKKQAGKFRSELLLNEIRKRVTFAKGTRWNKPCVGASLLQICLTAPTEAWVSFSNTLRSPLLSPLPAGIITVADDKAAPARAFKKLEEAFQRLGATPGEADLCIDLGASPGGWTAVLVAHNCTVVALDRSPLREDLMHHPRVTFISGDAFNYQPSKNITWMVCDLIAPAEKNLELLEKWLTVTALRASLKGFVITFKFKGAPNWAVLTKAKTLLSRQCEQWALQRLPSNKNEVTCMGLLTPS